MSATGRRHRPRAREQVLEAIRQAPRALFHVVGRPVHWERERAADPDRVDHVWITLDVGQVGLVRATLSTESWRNKIAGFDARVRIGRLPWTNPGVPDEGFRASDGLDYARIESGHPTDCPHRSRAEAEAFFLRMAEQSALVEAWGHPYINRHLGIHNIHSMRGSCAMPEDGDDGDGGIVFHPDKHDGTPELILLKFCGQP